MASLTLERASLVKYAVDRAGLSDHKYGHHGFSITTYLAGTALGPSVGWPVTLRTVGPGPADRRPVDKPGPSDWPWHEVADVEYLFVCWPADCQ